VVSRIQVVDGVTRTLTWMVIQPKPHATLQPPQLPADHCRARE
jgi:hypothetical protein